MSPHLIYEHCIYNSIFPSGSVCKDIRSSTTATPDIKFYFKNVPSRLSPYHTEGRQCVVNTMYWTIILQGTYPNNCMCTYETQTTKRWLFQLMHFLQWYDMEGTILSVIMHSGWYWLGVSCCGTGVLLSLWESTCWHQLVSSYSPHIVDPFSEGLSTNHADHVKDCQQSNHVYSHFLYWSCHHWSIIMFYSPSIVMRASIRTTN